MLRETTSLPAGDAEPVAADCKAAVDCFRNEVRAWIKKHCPPNMVGSQVIFHGGRKEVVPQEVLDWCALCFERGWTAPGWPKEYGGAGLDVIRQTIIREEIERHGAPLPLNGMGVTMIGPAILEFGTEEQKTRFLPEIAAGKVRWCQGFSEPEAGSDLAAVRTRGLLGEAICVVDGYKTWTTYGNLSDWMFCLVRTDTSAPKHSGISMVLLSMDSAGVSTRPIRLISGRSVFCECFFDSVEVPLENLLGQAGRGWGICKRILEFERSSVARPGSTINSGPASGIGGDGRTLSSIVLQYVGDDAGRIRDPALRLEVADIEMKMHALALLQKHQDEGGNQPPPMFKYLSTELTSRRMEVLIRALGFKGLGSDASSFSEDELEITRFWLYAKSFTIAGGSSEVLLDVISKRVLGMPT